VSTSPYEQVIDAMQREIDMLRANDHLAADNVGDWRELHQHWQADHVRAEKAELTLEKIRLFALSDPPNIEAIRETLRGVLPELDIR
jgi:hypothetical protein